MAGLLYEVEINSNKISRLPVLQKTSAKVSAWPTLKNYLKTDVSIKKLLKTSVTGDH